MNEQEELKKEFERDFDFSFPRIYWSDLLRNVILNFFNKWASKREQGLRDEIEMLKFTQISDEERESILQITSECIGLKTALEQSKKEIEILKDDRYGLEDELSSSKKEIERLTDFKSDIEESLDVSAYSKEITGVSALDKIIDLKKEVEGFKNKIYWLENPKTEPSHIWCRFAKEGRGDCEHFIGLPKVENETTTDEYGIPYGWCEYCWSCEKRKRLESELSSSKKREQELREALEKFDDHQCISYSPYCVSCVAKSLLSKLNKPSEGK